MKERIFIGHGIEVFRDGESFLLRYDAGEIADRLEDIVVSRADAYRSMRSESDAYDVIISWQNDQKQ